MQILVKIRVKFRQNRLPFLAASMGKIFTICDFSSKLGYMQIPVKTCLIKKRRRWLKAPHYTQKSGFGTSSLVLYVICVLGAKLGVLIHKNYHNKRCFLLRSNNSICFAKSFSLKSSALCKSKSIFLISSTFCGAPVFLSKIIS